MKLFLERGHFPRRPRALTWGWIRSRPLWAWAELSFALAWVKSRGRRVWAKLSNRRQLLFKSTLVLGTLPKDQRWLLPVLFKRKCETPCHEPHDGPCNKRPFPPLDLGIVPFEWSYELDDYYCKRCGVTKAAHRPRCEQGDIEAQAIREWRLNSK